MNETADLAGVPGLDQYERLAPRRNAPRTVDYFYAQDDRNAGALTWMGHVGCSDEWLAAHPDWGRDLESPDMWVRLPRPGRDGIKTVRVIVRDLTEGVIVDETYHVLAAENSSDKEG